MIDREFEKRGEAMSEIFDPNEGIEERHARAAREARRQIIDDQNAEIERLTADAKRLAKMLENIEQYNDDDQALINKYLHLGF